MSAADRAAFLAAIREHPDDDLPRLVFADWLDEHGEPERAEFIRLQIEFARLSAAGPGRDGLKARLDELKAREKHLLAAPGVTWHLRLPAGVMAGSSVRGFVGSVLVRDFAAFVGVADELFAAHPIYHLRVVDPRPQHLRSLARLPFLSGLTILDVGGGSISNQAVESFLRSPYLSRLGTLDLGSNRIGDLAAQRLAETSALPRLHTLDVSRNQITDVGAEALAASSHLNHLQRLDLRGNPIGAEGGALLRARYGGAVKL